MSNDKPASQISAAELLGAPQIEVKLPPTPDGSSFKAWAGYISYASIVELENDNDAADFSAETALYFLREVAVSRSSASRAQHIVRSSQDVAANPIDRVIIHLHLDGVYEGRAGGTEYRTNPGDLSILDLALPFNIRVTPFQALGLTVPRDMLPPAMRVRSLSGVVAQAEAPGTQLFARACQQFFDLLPGLREAEAFAAVLSLINLADAATQFAELGDVKPERRLKSDKTEVYDSVRRELEDRLTDLDLSVESIMRASGISRNALYRLFEADGGIQAYIRERRLWRCYEILSANFYSERTIKSIAADYAFPSEAHFSRVFKERFGITPRDLRAVAKNKRVAIEPSATGGVPFHWQKTKPV